MSTVTVTDSSGSVTVTESGSTVAVAGGSSTNEVFLKGDGVPSSSEGVVGQMYLDYTNKKWYGPKTAAGWGTAWATVPPGMESQLTDW